VLTDRDRWNGKHRAGGPERPSEALARQLPLLARGRALDLAGGTGANAEFLARAGFRVTLLDLSDEAVRRARGRGFAIVQGDALRLPFRGPFETIVVVKYLERSIAPDLVRLLAPGVTLYAEQPTAGLPDAYLVRPGEFPRLFRDLECLVHEEDDRRSVFLGRSTRPPRGKHDASSELR
jgi:SAM-dependent methyltransferase